ncbi:piggyBac transposable element-derived protein 4-like isoform X2 [Brienomyrus brachyistius]|uniref:piggyBac transposable element-derived protein 4-like isoform X2 n=1 Tax=Brienomyrus brachyistius TaxID=42636 RepID=UPI0020B2EAD5|nr:piggyBac transposable element-derived protein 4-like isoform X2 [Brienomyrus brachyistius]XP_048853946.1 piggyBac transposable element-derived protein 4-like isoform X2 [Brienomyrus brachyistius]XP_048853948.1 piggyBac transposable element-derived protein 4-like isoform X2 [Brienomyrus brachyistius]XP_048853949.1 piggyBac transposable element-derived protein 4-like isoform X2 [Brienomyrus brachyistius]
MAKRTSAQRDLDPVLEETESSSEEDDEEASEWEYKEATESESDTADKPDLKRRPRKSPKTVEQDAPQQPEQRPGEIFMSRKGQIEWSSSPKIAQPRSPTKLKMIPGPTRMAVSRVHDIRSAFELFLPDSIQKIVRKMTNIEGKRIFRKQWKEVDDTEMLAYYGILILAGVFKSRGESASSLWDGEKGIPFFKAAMSLGSFSMFSRAIRFDEWATRRERRQKDKLAEIRTVWDKWVKRLPLMYNPGPNVTVDERLIAFKGRCPFRQYMPSKPAKYGIKIWAACDAASAYGWNMQIYTGKVKGGISEKNQGMRVVLDMTQGLSGHNITCDNFFTSYNLGQELLKRNMTMVGTVRHNKPELPPELLTVKGREVTSSQFAFTANTTLVSYVPRKGKNVMLMSTLHREGQISDRKHKKPEIILQYNARKGGVDTLNMVTAHYSCRRKTSRWPLVVFFDMLDVSAYNAFVIWLAVDPYWEKSRCGKRRRLFLEELGKALVFPHIQRRQNLPRSPAAALIARKIQEAAGEGPHAGSKLQLPTGVAAGGQRKRCKDCPPSKDLKTRFMCITCDKFICLTHAAKMCKDCV